MSGVTKDQYAVGSDDWVRAQTYWLLQGGGQWPWVRDVFPDVVIVTFDGDTRLFAYPWSIEGGEIVLGEPTEVAVEYVQKRRAEIDSPELTGPIIKADPDKRIVYAPVLVPDEPDIDGDIVTAEKIEEVAHLWLEKYQNLDLGHTLNNVALPVESYVTQTDISFPGGVVPKGSWMLAARVPEELWPSVVKGELGGFSLMAVRTDQAAAAIKGEVEIEAAAKRTTLADLGDDWVVPFVSIVDRPAVPKAKWVALKSATPQPGMLARFKRALLPPEPVEKAGRKFSDATYSRLTAAVEALGALVEEAEKERAEKSSGPPAQKGPIDMTPEELAAAVSSAVKGELEPIVARLDAIEGQSAETPETPAEPAGDDAGDDVAALKAEIETLKAQNAEHEQFRTSVQERLKAAPKGLVGQDGAGDKPATKSDEFEEYTDVSGVKYRRDASGRARQVA